MDLSRLSDIRELNRKVRPRDADVQLRQLLDQISVSDIESNLDEIRIVIDEFLPKRRHDLEQVLKSRLAGTASASLVVNRPDSFYVNLRASLRSRLKELGLKHIFQWATFYRDEIGEIFKEFVQLAREIPTDPQWAEILLDEFKRHALEVFERGFEHNLGSQQLGRENALFKSLHGLERFLTLPISFFLANTSSKVEVIDARCLRMICSAILAGILCGYGEASFGPKQEGWKALTKESAAKRWAHAVAFLCHDHLRNFVDQLRGGDIASGLRINVVPVIEAVDELLKSPDYFVIPTICEYIPERGKRLEMLFTAPRATDGGRKLDIYCYLNQLDVDRPRLEESGSRGAVVVVAPLRSDFQEWVEAHELLHRIVINSSAVTGGTPVAMAAQIRQRLVENAALNKDGDRQLVLAYNYARHFPLEKLSWKKFFYIHRPSVRDLLHSFEGSTGATSGAAFAEAGKPPQDSNSRPQRTVLSSSAKPATARANKREMIFSILASPKFSTADDVCRLASSTKPCELAHCKKLAARRLYLY